jgi:hypothetical protein
MNITQHLSCVPRFEAGSATCDGVFTQTSLLAQRAIHDARRTVGTSLVDGLAGNCSMARGALSQLQQRQ